MPEAQVTPVMATQSTYTISTPRGEFTLPGLAYDDKGAITIASLLDVLIVAAASPDQATRDQVLAANDMIVRDNNGKLFFPPPTEQKQP